MANWVARTPWVEFLAEVPVTRSTTALCLKLTAPWFAALDEDTAFKAVRRIAALLDKEAVAFDIAGHRDAPAGLRIWGGPTVEAGDIALMLPWIEWAHATVEAEYAPEATSSTKAAE